MNIIERFVVRLLRWRSVQKDDMCHTRIGETGYCLGSSARRYLEWASIGDDLIITEVHRIPLLYICSTYL